MASPPPQVPAAGASGPPLPWFLQSGARLFGILVLTLVVLIGTFSYVVSTEIQRILRVDAARHDTLTAELIAPLVAEHFLSLMHYLESYARRPMLVEAVTRHDPKRARAALAELVESNPGVSRAFITDAGGTLWADYPPAPEVNGQNFASRDWFKGVSGGKETYVSGVYRRAAPPKSHLVAVATPLRNDRGETIGYLVEQQTIATMVDWLSNVEAAGGGRVSLIDNRGRVVASRENGASDLLSLEQHHLVRQGMQGRSGTEQMPDPLTGQESVISYSPIAPLGWTVLVSNPVEHMLAPVATVQRSLLGFAVVLLLVMVVLTYFWVNTLRRYNGELSERETRFRGLLESAPDAIVTVDREGHIVLANSQTEYWFGYRHGELLGQPVEILVPEVLRGSHIQHRDHYLMAPHTRPMGAGIELKGRCKDGREFPIEVSLSPLKTKEGPLITAIIRDISERKKQEDALQQYMLQLEAANRELESFSYSVSHDLRTPLRAIDGFSHVLLDDCGEALGEDCREYLRRVRSASQRMAMLIDDLLKLATVTRSDLVSEEVSLSHLAEQVIEDLRNSDPQREVEVAITPGLSVTGDHRLLHIALENLLSNAWKFTANRRPARIEFGQSEFAGRPAYRVRDNGVGFDMAYADKLFAPFQRLHDQSEFPGTGIGLATVQRILRKHGGHIWAESVPGQGASFYFTL